MLFATAPFALAEESNDFANAITSGKAGVNVRPRYENVDQDNIDKKTNAVIVRFRLNYKTGT